MTQRAPEVLLSQRLSILTPLRGQERTKALPWEMLSERDKGDIISDQKRRAENNELFGPEIRNAAYAFLLGIDPEKKILSGVRKELTTFQAQAIVPQEYTHEGTLSFISMSKQVYPDMPQAAFIIPLVKSITDLSSAQLYADILMLFPGKPISEIMLMTKSPFEHSLWTVWKKAAEAEKLSGRPSSLQNYAKQLAYMRLLFQESFDYSQLVSPADLHDIEQQLEQLYSSKNWEEFLPLCMHYAMLRSPNLHINKDGLIEIELPKTEVAETIDTLPQIRRLS